MQLQDDLLKGFAEAINSESDSTPADVTVYAEVTRVDGDVVYIKMDGADIETPATTMVKVGVGDRVFAAIKDHSVVITGNISYPSLTRVGDVYITLRADGLVVGKLNENNEPTDVYVLITDTDFNVIDKFGSVLARFGTTAQIGLSNGRHLNITEEGVDILNGKTTLAQFSDSLITLANGLAEFSSKHIKLGNTTDAQVRFCNDRGVISYDENKFKMEGNGTTQVVGVSNSYSTYKSELLAEAKSGSQRVGMQVVNNGNAVASVIADKNGVNCAVPSGKALTENGTEVVKVNGVIATGTILQYTSGHYEETHANAYSADITVTKIPAGYSLVGISEFRVYASSYATDSNHWSLSDCYLVNSTKIHVRFVATPTTVYHGTFSSGSEYWSLKPMILPDRIWLKWFAIRTSGVINGGSQIIDS